jgi:type I restriction-modification system DNA methylase subunit
MNADDFRDYMLSFLFLRYLSHNYEEAAKKELGGNRFAFQPIHFNRYSCLHIGFEEMQKTR